MNVRFDDGEKLLVLCEEQGRGVVWAFEDVAARPTVHRSDGMNTALRAEPAEAGAWHADGAFVSNGEHAKVKREAKQEGKQETKKGQEHGHSAFRTLCVSCKRANKHYGRDKCRGELKHTEADWEVAQQEDAAATIERQAAAEANTTTEGQAAAVDQAAAEAQVAAAQPACHAAEAQAPLTAVTKEAPKAKGGAKAKEALKAPEPKKRAGRRNDERAQ
jgi:hypothetical protein